MSFRISLARSSIICSPRDFQLQLEPVYFSFASARARLNTARNMGRVSLPVLVFCSEGWWLADDDQRQCALRQCKDKPGPRMNRSASAPRPADPSNAMRPRQTTTCQTADASPLIEPCRAIALFLRCGLVARRAQRTTALADPQAAQLHSVIAEVAFACGVLNPASCRTGKTENRPTCRRCWPPCAVRSMGSTVPAQEHLHSCR